MCPLLAQLKIGFFSSFSDAAVYSTNEANKTGLKQSIIFRCLCLKLPISPFHHQGSQKAFVTDRQAWLAVYDIDVSALKK
jgi:hypothetical protein